MQVTDIRVRPADGAGVVVDFFGEGGDLVQVQFAHGDIIPDDQGAIAKAKAILVQVATFDEIS